MMNQNSDYNLKLQLAQELERAVRGQKINQELYDYLLSTIQQVFEYSKDNQIILPKPENLLYSLTMIHKLIDSVNANHIKFYQPMGNTYKTTDNETEPEMTPAKTEILV